MTLRAGDVAIQRATAHAWSNRTDKIARVMFVLYRDRPDQPRRDRRAAVGRQDAGAGVIVDPAAADGEIIWRPDPADARRHADRAVRRVRPRTVVSPLGEGYQALWAWSVDDPDAFWSSFVEFAGIRLGGEPGPARNGEPMPATRWFPGRTLNFARHLLEGRDGTAIDRGVRGRHHRRDARSTRCAAQVGALAAHLRSLGVGAGDRVVAVLPNVPEAVVGLLAAASIGAVWSVCSPEFGPGAIVSRFAQLEPKAVLAAPGYRLGRQGPRPAGGARTRSCSSCPPSRRSSG